MRLTVAASRHSLAVLGSVMALTVVAPLVVSYGPGSAARATSARQVATARDGLLLGLYDGTFYSLNGEKGASIPGEEISPDGAHAAYSVLCAPDVGGACNETTSTLHIVDTAGTDLEIGSLKGNIFGISWSPDQQQLAVMVADDDSDCCDRGIIYRVPVSGAAPVKLLQSDPHLVPDASSGISWNPVNNRIAFVATETQGTPGDDNYTQDYAQTYTVPSGGGTWSRYNAHPPQPAPSSVATSYQFHAVEWSPDGSRLLAYVSEYIDDLNTGDSDFNQYVATISAGALKPTEVKRLQTGVHGDGTDTAAGRPRWSVDGSKVLYQTHDAQFRVTAHLLANGADTVLPVPEISDWQRCPTGTCPSWSAPTAPQLILGYATSPRMKAVGSVQPNSGGVVKVTFEKKFKGKWRVVVKKSAVLSAAGNFTTTINKKPTSAKCRLTATYGSAVARHTFTCPGYTGGF